MVIIMNVVEIYGWACAIVGSVGSLPQVIRLLRSQTTAGLALVMWQLTAAASLGWVLHGVRGGWWNMIVPNAMIGIWAMLVIAMVQRDRGLPHAKAWPPVLAVAGVLFAVELFTNPTLFGVAVLMPLAVGQLGQSRDLVVAADITGVAPLTVLLNAAIPTMWLVWGIAAGDAAVVICSAVLGLVALFNLVWFALRTGGRVRVPA